MPNMAEIKPLTIVTTNGDLEWPHYTILYKNDIIYETAYPRSRLPYIAYMAEQWIEKANTTSYSDFIQFSVHPDKTQRMYESIIRNDLRPDKIRFYTIAGEAIIPEVPDVTETGSPRWSPSQ